MQPTFNELVGAILGFTAVLVVGYLAAFHDNEQALGALILIVGSAAGYFLRGKLQNPTP